jgi:hypothetical protein
MKKWRFLAPLAVSVAALLSGAATPSNAAVERAVTEITPPAASSPVGTTEPLVLTRAAEGAVQLADHTSHVSHSSHSSHSSHVSGS